MDTKNDFIIRFAGLSNGSHHVEFNIDDSFFEKYPYSEIKKGKLIASIEVLKQTMLLVLTVSIKGTVDVECDRCMEVFEMPVQSENQLIVKLSTEDLGDEDEDVVALPVVAHEIDISQYVYEYVTVSLPLQRIHPDDENGNSTCNPEVLKNLNQLLIKKNNQEQTDPRWQALKNIKLNQPGKIN